MTSNGQYVLITPAKNEELLISATIESVKNQTVLPLEWIVVSDGSTDRTDDIVRNAAARYPWIRLLALPLRSGRNFAAVVHAIEAGIRTLNATDYTYIGLLDSDVSFQPNYFASVIECFRSSPRLGLAGGVVIDVGLPRNRLPRNREDVPGAVQFFRRDCFQKLGGLLAIPEGGWDALTCARARMVGYETKLLTGLIVDHLKPRNISEGGIFRRKWQMGVRDYALGYHPMFELFKCFLRITDPPIFVGAVSWWIGYCSAAIQGRQLVIPVDLKDFVRSEQKMRLWRMFRGAKRIVKPQSATG